MKNLLCLSLTCLLLALIWFRGRTIIGGGDEGLPFYDVAQYSNLVSSAWRDVNSGYNSVSDVSRLPFFVIVKIVHSLGVSSYLAQAFTFFLLMVVGTVSVYFLLKEMIGDKGERKHIPLIGGIFYLLNPFSMTQIWGRLFFTQYFSFALIPLFMLFFILGIRKKKFFYGVLAGLSSFALSATFSHISYVVSLWAVVLVYFTLHFLTHRTSPNKSFAIFFTVVTLAIWVLMNFWWIVGLAKDGGTFYSYFLEQDNIASLQAVSAYFPLHSILRLIQDSYIFNPKLYDRIYFSGLFQLISWLIPLVSLFSLSFLKKIKELKFFALLFLLGLFVSLGANFPLGWLFTFLFTHILPLQAFRNPYEKFGIVLTLAYTPFFSLGAVNLSTKISKLVPELYRTRIYYLTLLTIIFLVSGLYVWPMWTGLAVANSDDKKIGVEVPHYYADLKQWLVQHDSSGENNRLVMTPIPAGSYVTYKWNDRTYYGVDPTIFLLGYSAISNTLETPFVYDFMTYLRRYIGSINIVPTLSILRAKYLVSRGDMDITAMQQNHLKYLTEAIYSPLGISPDEKEICQDRLPFYQGMVVPWIACSLSSEEGDWTHIKYLQVAVKTDTPAAIEVALQDNLGRRPRWVGTKVKEYQTNGKDWIVMTIPLDAPTEDNDRVDFSSIRVVEILAYNLFSKDPVKGLSLKGIWLDPGKKEKINEFKFVETFGKLKIYEPTDFNPPPEYGTVTGVEKVDSFLDLFESAAEKRKVLNNTVFILADQNKGKDISLLSQRVQANVSKKAKVSETKYSLIINSPEVSYLILSKTFNNNWKILPGVRKEELDGSILSNLRLLKREFIPEDNHFVVNGYANLWKVDGKFRDYALVYLPQIYIDLGLQISLITVSSLTIYLLIYLAKKKNLLKLPSYEEKL